jgi:hypothetical protein
MAFTRRETLLPAGTQKTAAREEGCGRSHRQDDLRHRFGYRMAEIVPLHRLAQLWAMTHLTQP